METWGIIIFIVGLILYFITKRKVFFLFVAGAGAGIVIGAEWALSIIRSNFGF
jgi:hypothetical protein